MIQRKQDKNQIKDEVERYLSRQRVCENLQDQADENILQKMDKIVQQICQVSTCSALKNIRQVSHKVNIEDMISQQNLQPQRINELFKTVLYQNQQLRKIYADILKQNQNVKRIIQTYPHQQFSIYEQNIQFLQPLQTIVAVPKEPLDIFVSLPEAQKIIIQAQSFLSLKIDINNQ